jgi:NAD-dependent SIR2 family protein deacetylase
MFPGSYRPTPVHFFVALLAQKQLLLRNYTQNIDTLERVAGVPPELLVEAHGESTLSLSRTSHQPETSRFVWRRSLHRLPRRCDH